MEERKEGKIERRKDETLRDAQSDERKDKLEIINDKLGAKVSDKKKSENRNKNVEERLLVELWNC